MAYTSVPRLSRDLIEEKAEQVLAWHSELGMNIPQCSQVASIVMTLAKLGKVTFNCRESLGRTRKGSTIHGAFQFDPPTIYIDESLPHDSARFKFVLAHELAHFVLHRKLHLDPATIDLPNRLSDDRYTLHLRRIGSRLLQTPRDWLEWQANILAGAILVPRATLQQAIMEKQRSLGITRNLGVIYVDPQLENRLNHRRIMDHLLSVYQVSRTVLAIRLEELNLINDRYISSWTQVGRLFLADDS